MNLLKYLWFAILSALAILGSIVIGSLVIGLFFYAVASIFERSIDLIAKIH